MPDGMKSPEQPGSSFDAMRHLGATQNFQPTSKSEIIGAKEQLETAQNFPRPELSSSMPDIRMQLKGGDDDRDPNKERLDHEMRMQEMYGEGKAGYLGTFLSSVSSLNVIEKDTRELDTQILYVRRNKARLLGNKERMVMKKSLNVQEARNSLKTEVEELRAIVDSNKDRKMMVKTKGGEIDAVQMANRELASATDLLLREPIERERMLEATREKLAESYEKIIHTSLDEIGSLNRYLENLKNPYPYDSRWNLQFFEQALERITDKLRSKEKLSAEGMALMRLLKRDMLWASSNARVVEGMGPAFEAYFDGELMLQWVRTPHTELVARDFIRLNQKKLQGAELDTIQRELVKRTLSKRESLASFGIENINGIDKRVERLGLREVAIDYQDACVKWLYSGIAAGQKNLEILDYNTWTEDSVKKEEGNHYSVLKDEVEFRFLQEMLSLESSDTIEYVNKDGVKISVKDQLLNPFCMPKGDEKAHMAFMTRMMILVSKSNDIEYRLQKIREIADKNQQLIEIKKLVGGVVGMPDGSVKYEGLLGEAKRLEEAWEALDERNPYDRLADSVVRSMVNIEKGVLAGGDLGWSWKYEKDVSYKIFTDPRLGEYIIKGKPIYKEKVSDHIWMGLSETYTIQKGADGKEFIEERTYKKDVDKSEWNDLTADFATSGTDKKIVSRMDKVVKSTESNENSYVIKRKSEMGSIYENHDVTTVVFLARHIIDYDMLADTRGTGVLVFPSVGSYRERWESEPPYFRPRIEEFAKNDTELRKTLGIGLNGEIVPGGVLSENNPLEDKSARKVFAKGVNGLVDQKYGKFDPRARDFIKNNVWAFVTPFLDKPGDVNSEYLVMPIFIPTMLDINFWKGVSLDKPSARTSDHKSMSIWHKRLEGKTKNSELDWGNMDKYKYSWIRVTHDQMERWLGPIITPHEYNRSTAPEYEKHYNKPSGKSEKEGGKRARLGGRMFDFEDGVIRATSFAQNKVLASISLSGIMGTKLKNPGTIRAEIANWRENWVGPWMDVDLDMPSKVRKIYNFPGTAAQSASITYLQAKRIIESVAKHSEGQEADVVRSLASMETLFR